MGLFSTPEEKERKLLYKEEMKNLLNQMEPTGKIALTAKWDDNLGVIYVGAFGLGTVIKYDTITNVQVKQEVKLITESTGKTKKKGVITRSVVGGVLFGPAGAIIGGATAKEKTVGHSETRQEIVKTIVVTREDPYRPVLSFSYDSQLEDKLRTILFENNQKKLPPTPVETIEYSETKVVSVADEILKLKQLLDDGILTEDEFQAQKKKLLDK